MEGHVNPHIVGTYTLTYKVSDAEGNAAAEITRTVNVKGQEYTISNAIFRDASGNPLTLLPKKGFVTVTADMKSNTSTPTAVTLVLVLYNKKGEIENITGITQSISPGSTETFTGGFMMPGNNSGYDAKLFVADSLTSLQPLSNVGSLQQK